MRRRQLIDSSELSKHLNDDSWRIIDCRFDLSDPEAGRRDYEQAHIPGAVFVDLNLDLASPPTPSSGRHPLPDIGKLSATFGLFGIDSETNVVVYDASNGALAARAWWLLRWLGHDNVKLLDGGYLRWAAEHPVSQDRVTVNTKAFLPRVRHELCITTAEIMEAVSTQESLNILDARDPARFNGIVEPIDAVAGHVPGARNFPFQGNLRTDGLWKSQVELQALWEQCLGRERDSPWVAMCGSGVTACHLAISALEAGYAEPRLYVGSWSEWIVDPDRPVAPG